MKRNYLKYREMTAAPSHIYRKQYFHTSFDPVRTIFLIWAFL